MARPGDDVARASGHPESRLIDMGPTEGFDFAKELDEIPFGRSQAELDDLHAGLEEYLADQVVVQADNQHFARLAAGVKYAKWHLGGANAKLSRVLEWEDGERRVFYVCALTAVTEMKIFGAGDTPELAVDNAIQNLEDLHYIEPAFGGYRVPGLAVIAGGYDRSTTESLDLARRCLLVPNYLAEAIRFALPGVSEEAPAPRSIEVRAA